MFRGIFKTLTDVAPHAGAWIETRHLSMSRAAFASRLTQARGLKRAYVDIGGTGKNVAPHAGAWIET